MGSENEVVQKQDVIEVEEQGEASTPYYLAKFKLYETRSTADSEELSSHHLVALVRDHAPSTLSMQFMMHTREAMNLYMVGRDKSKRVWRVLKIDRLEPSDLVICEDPTLYSLRECCVLLRRIHEGNRCTGGLKFVTTCYGIVGFIKFLGPYYILLITKRRKVGMICGHAIYAISKSKMIPIPHSTVRSNMDNSKNENRYKKLLCSVDITKDFFFSYSYQVMHSLQKNLCDSEIGMMSYDTMFVWNGYLTQGIRNNLSNTLWTVALVHGFFRQVKFSKSGRTFSVTLIARRSRHYAGTRYLKRGINKKGRAANEVETEQIVFEEIPGGNPSAISSVVQIRGSIPLFWSQATSRLNIKPDIILSNEDPNYEATKLHFQNLVARYGNPIILLNLIKKLEKKPRESILHAEFSKAVAFINRGLAKEKHVKLQTMDLHRFFQIKGTKVFMQLNRVAAHALGETGFFYCQDIPYVNSGGLFNWSSLGVEHGNIPSYARNFQPAKPLRLQSGVLRTNCIDCLDRTNVAQYAYGFVALGHQLHALGISDAPEIDIDDPFAYKLMGVYEAMGDTLALQYGGSAAHNKIFSERRGQWKAATHSQEFIRTLQRYLSNAYMDAIKQDAINLFLGHFQPEVGRPALWELDSDQHHNIGSLSPSFSEDIARSILKRSLSEGNIIIESCTPMAITPSDVRCEGNSDHPLPDIEGGNIKGLSESQPVIATSERDMISPCGTGISYSRHNPSMSARQLFTDIPEGRGLEGGYFSEHDDEFDSSDIVDLDGISSSGNSFEEETFDRSSLLSSPTGSSYGHALNDIAVEGRAHRAHNSPEYSDRFVQWVEHGGTLIH
ncbi:hypothetical protein Ancab_011897 [Ancistrocladus abbreviatus]